MTNVFVMKRSRCYTECALYLSPRTRGVEEKRSIMKEASDTNAALLNRDEEIVRDVLEGETFKEIGLRHGISGERVRQIALPFLAEAKEKRTAAQNKKIQDQREKALKRVPEVAQANPGMTPSEIAREVGFITSQDVYAHLPDSDALRRQAAMRPALGRRFTREDAKQALRNASDDKLEKPVTMAHYRSVSPSAGPSAETILSLYDSWHAACEDAGVPAGSSTKEYIRPWWTEDELLNTAVRFFSEIGVQGSMDAYSAWAKKQKSNVPSVSLLRKKFGSWGEVRIRASALLSG